MATAVHSKGLALAATSPRINPVALPTNITVGTTNISAGAVTGPKIATDAVGTGNIAAGAVTDTKIAAVDAVKITTGTLDAARISAGSLDAKVLTVDAAKITTGTLDAARIGAASITNAQIAALDAGKITTGTLDAARVSAGSLDAKVLTVDAAKITTGTLDTARIGAASITNAQIAALDAGKITTGTLDAARVSAGSLDAKVLTVDAAKITSGTLDTARIGAASITAAKIANATITDAQIASLNAGKISAGTLSANFVNGGTLSGSSINITGTGGHSFTAGPTLGYATIGNLVGFGYAEFASGSAAKPAVYGSQAYNNLAVHGAVGYTNSGGNAHGVRGENAYNGATGLVGAANGYDFYADGSGTNYGPFTGAHDALVPIGAVLDIGDIVCDVGVAVRKNVSNTICHVARSSAPGQGAAVGVVAAPARSLNAGGHIPAALIDFRWTTTQPDGTTLSCDVPCREFSDLRWTHAVIAINALGEGQINVCGEGGDLQPGDLITTSSTPGKGMRQADDVVRAHSVAKCREAIAFDHPGQVVAVACIYLCG